MSEIRHFKNYSYVDGRITVRLNLDRFSQQLADAQHWFSHQVLRDCDPYMPKQAGLFIDRSYVSSDEKHVVFPGPSARYLYMGFVMVDRQTGRGPIPIRDRQTGELTFRYRKGAKLIPSSRRLNYSTTANAQTTDRWFDHAKVAHQNYWISTVKRIGGGGRR